MSFVNDPYVDEDGEGLMNYDDFNSDPEPQEGEPGNPVEDNLDDADVDGAWNHRERTPPTPVHDDFKAKPRKRLVKKSSGAGASERALDDYGVGVEEDMAGLVRDESDDGLMPSSSSGMKGKKLSGSGGSVPRRKEKRRMEGGKGEKRFKPRRAAESGPSRGRDDEKAMWDTVAPDNSEDDVEGPRTMDDDNFIDDTGVDPADRYGSDREHSPSRAPQAEEGEEDDEMKELFKVGKKKKKIEKSANEIGVLVVKVLEELELAAEEDAELNRQSKPAINKLKKLPLLTEALAKKQLQQEFLDHGVLTLLKNWLEPLPDGSLPNINIRAAILKILSDYPIDLGQHERREQLKNCGLGKVIMFLSKSDEETTSNRKLAKDLVDQWSRPIFNKSTRFEDMRDYEDEKVAFRRASVKKPMNKSAVESRDDDLDLAGFSQGSKSGQSSSRQLTSRPEAISMDFLVRPQSKVDPEEVRARAKQMVLDQRRQKMNKKLQQLKAPKRKQLQATKLSVEGRGMVKYL